MSKVITLTSTYDHRIIQGAESGEFLGRIHELLLGEDDFYDDVFASFGVPYEPALGVARPQAARRVRRSSVDKALAVKGLINMYRVRGHLIANLDPLGTEGTAHAPSSTRSTRASRSGTSTASSRPAASPASRSMRCATSSAILRDAYCPHHRRRVHAHPGARPEGVDPARRSRVCTSALSRRREAPDPRALNAAEAFERFLHTKYLGQKRFSLEGAETLIPMLAFLLDEAADAGVDEVVIGMAHRGRLNVLANVVGKSYAQIFREFEGELDPNVPQGSGDVKYHLGATGKHTAPAGRRSAHARREPEPPRRPSTRSSRAWRAPSRTAPATPHEQGAAVLIHGDAAFAGQGVVAETLNLSELPGYDVGGTVHVVVNNQVGFTTRPARRARPCTHRRRQDGAGADLPRERRRPRGGACA